MSGQDFEFVKGVKGFSSIPNLLLTDKYFRRGCCHFHNDQIGKKAKLLIHHKQQDFEPQTHMGEGRVNAHSMGIELATSSQLVVALAN